MPKNQFKLQLRGLKEDNEHIRLGDFIEELTAIKETLTEIDKHISEVKSPTTDYRIIDLTHNSPSAVIIEAIPSNSNIDKSSEIVDTFFYGLEKIQKGIAPDNFDSFILEKYKKISGVFKRRINEVTLYYEEDSILIDKTLENKIALILGEDEVIDGYVDGSLEMINFHRDANKFTIYPVLGSEKVICHFPKEILSDAIKAVGEYIQVIGKLKFKRRDNFPYAVEVSEIKIHLRENEIPSLMSLRGIAPNTLGGLSSEAFIKKIRHAK